MAETTGTDWTQIKAATIHGTQPKGQASDGTGAPDHLAAYNDDGSLTDSNVSIADLVVASAGLQQIYVNNPTVALSQPTTTSIAMPQVAVQLGAATLNYAARTFTISAPSVATYYYVTIADPTLAGDSGGIPTLTAYCETTQAKVGLPGYTYIGFIKAAATIGNDIFPGPGGWPPPFLILFEFGGEGGGGGGGGTGSGYADAEMPSGALDGSNTVFTLAHTPNAPLLLVLNGILQLEGTDYTVSGNTITFASAPGSSDWTLVWYRYGTASTVTFIDGEVPAGTKDGANQSFTLAATPDTDSLILALDGVVQQNSVDFTLSTATFTYVLSAPVGSDWQAAWYRSGGTLGGLNFAPAETPTGSISGSNSIFTLAHSPAPGASVFLVKNGIAQRNGVEFTLSGNTITYATTPSSGDWHLCWYRY